MCTTSTNPGRRWLRLAIAGPLLAATFVTGCSTVVLPSPSASASTVESLRQARLAAVKTGRFSLAPGRDPAMDTRAGGLQGHSIVPPAGSFARQLGDTIGAELKAAGLYDQTANILIEGQLTDSQMDASDLFGTVQMRRSWARITGREDPDSAAKDCKARLAARFIVLRDGRQVFDRELSVESSWDPTPGGVDAQTASDNYAALYRALAARLLNDPDFRGAVAR